ncbi:MAG: hypothetical protein KIT24_08935 [Phycisphaeraceae bacterium]|nr:hypothetical protein [Phycisphaeraceae bacterium]
MRAHRYSRVLGVGAVAALLFSAGAVQPEEPPLRGPRVERGAEEGTGRFVRGQRPDQPAEAGVLGGPAIVRLVRVLGSEQVDASLRLTEEQRDRIQEVMRSHAAAGAAYVGERRGEIVKLLRDAGHEVLASRVERAEGIDLQVLDRLSEELRGRARGPQLRLRGEEGISEGRMAEMSEAQRQAIRGLMRIRREGPAADLQRDVADILTQAQRDWMRDRLAEASGGGGLMPRPAPPPADMREPMPGQSGAPRVGGGRPGPAPRDAAPVVRSERLSRLLEGMTVEEQERLADVIERMRLRPNAPAGRGGERPRPSMEDVNVPRPGGSQ